MKHLLLALFGWAVAVTGLALFDWRLAVVAVGVSIAWVALFVDWGDDR